MPHTNHPHEPSKLHEKSRTNSCSAAGCGRQNRLREHNRATRYGPALIRKNCRTTRKYSESVNPYQILTATGFAEDFEARPTHFLARPKHLLCPLFRVPKPVSPLFRASIPIRRFDVPAEPDPHPLSALEPQSNPPVPPRFGPTLPDLSNHPKFGLPQFAPEATAPPRSQQQPRCPPRSPPTSPSGSAAIEFPPPVALQPRGGEALRFPEQPVRQTQSERPKLPAHVALAAPLHSPASPARECV